MVKSRFSSVDVRAMVNSIRPSIVGCKLTNIYDLNSRVYILKLARRGFKCFLLLESGMRFHLTSYDRDKSAVPSNYTMKLRKHIRTRRLTAVEQLGCDRCVVLTFGKGENSFHLILELYVSGNLLLTDHEYRILALLRTHADERSKVALREVYPTDTAIGLLTVPIEKFETAIDGILNVVAQRQETQEVKELEADDDKAKGEKGKAASAFAKRSKKRVAHSAMPLAQLLHKLAPFADPGLCSSSLTKALALIGVPCKNAFKLTVDDYAFEDVVELLQKAAELALETLRSVSRPCDLGGGSMPVLEAPAEVDEQDLAAEDAEEAAEDEDEAGAGGAREAGVGAAAGGGGAAASTQGAAAGEAEAVTVPGWILRRRVHVPPTEPYWANDEFTPLPPSGAQGSAEPADPEAIVAFPTFHQCVDEFYTKVEEHRAAEQKAQHAKTVFDKVQRIKDDQGRRVEALEAEQSASERQALLIEANVGLVEMALAMVNTMLASQIDWGDLWREVRRQQRLGHPIAQHIHALNFERNEMQFLLSGLDNDMDPDGELDRPMELVPLDLNLSPHANVARLHSKRKETRDKTSRTVMHAESAIKQAERKAQQDLQKFQLKQTIRRVRQTWWFEKFFWFVSSENYIVVAGHDPQQTDQIFCKHIGPKDVFVQADVVGARTCFIRNPSGDEVPPATLREAGTMTLCHSTAWDKRIVISAWWVPVEQVTRGGPPSTSDVVLVDGFAVRGRRHFMPPVHLEMGLTLLFHVGGEASAARHRGERRSRYLEAMGAVACGDGDGAGEGEGEGGAGEAESGDEDDGESVEVAEEDGEAKDCADDSQGDDTPAAPEKGLDDAEVSAEEEAAMEASNEGGAGGSEGAAGAGDEEAEEQEQEQVEARRGGGGEEKAAKGARARLSKAERRRQKKEEGGTDTAGSPLADEGDGGNVDPDAFTPPPRGPAAPGKKGVTSAPAAIAPKPLPRGQKAKAKKIKDKYGDQDEDEKLLRLALLGSKDTKLVAAQKAPSAPSASVEAGADEAEGDTSAGVGAARAAPCADVDGGGALGAVETGEGPGIGGGKGKGGRGKGGGKGPADGGRSQVCLKPGCEAEEGGPSFNQFGQLDLLTGQPQADDEVLYAMAMVAPYCALGGPYTYRAKLTPGQGKKGQVVKQCLKMFEAQIDRQAWKLLVQAIPENDTAGLMMGSCKASMPGMQKLQQQVQKEKKKEKQLRDGGPAGGGGKR